MSLRRFSISCVAAALSACVALPPSTPPATQLNANQLHLDAPEVSVFNPDWWTRFNDAQLNQLMVRALDHNPSLIDAMARLTHARAAVSAVSTTLRPTVDANASLSRDRFSESYIYPPPFGGTSWWNGQVNLGAYWDPDFWGRQRQLIGAAAHGANARSFDLWGARSALESTLLSAYFELDQQYQLLELTKAYEDDRLQMASLIQRRVAAGLDSEVDQKAANVLLPDARTARSHAVAEVELREHHIRSLIGAPQDEVIARPSINYGDVLVLPTVVPGDLLLRRADVQAALERVSAATSQETAAQLAFYPTLNLTGFIGFSALTLPDLLSAPSRQYGVGPGLSLPIFDAGRLHAQLIGARADVDAAIAQYNATVLRAVQEVADQLTRLRALESEQRDQDDKLAQLMSARSLAERRAAGGLTSQLPVLEADMRALMARIQWIHIRALRAEARIALVIAIGTGNSPPSSLEKAQP